MEKEKYYDKPRITSTIIIGIFMTITIVIIGLLYPVSWKAINEAGSGNVGDVFVVFFAALGIVLIIFVLAFTLIPSILCLIFSIKNRHSTVKAVRIISYVYDGLISAAIVAAVLKAVLLLCGI